MKANSLFSLFDTIKTHISDFEGDLYTGAPAIVENYDPATSTIDVYPAIYKKDKADGTLIKELLLERVPVIFNATRELGITYPIRKGDTVWLMFSHRDSEGWLVSEEEYAEPKTHRKHDINDAFAIAGAFKYNNSPVPQGQENNLCIRYNDNDIIITPDGELIVNSANTITINAPNQNVEITASNVNCTGNINAQGNITSQSDISATGDVSDGTGPLGSLRQNYNKATYLVNAVGAPTNTTDSPDP